MNDPKPPRIRTGGVVNLSCHRNTLEQRKQHKARKDIKRAVRELVSQHPDMRGWVVVAWDKSGNATAQWDTGDTMRGDTLPSYVKRVIERTVNMSDVQ